MSDEDFGLPSGIEHYLDQIEVLRRAVAGKDLTIAHQAEELHAAAIERRKFFEVVARLRDALKSLEALVAGTKPDDDGWLAEALSAIRSALS